MVVRRSENGKKSATNAADEKQKPGSKLWLSLIKTLLIASTIFPNSCALWRAFSHNPGKSVSVVKTVPKSFHLLSPKGGYMEMAFG